MRVQLPFAIGVMAKAPVAGAVKTRLIPLLGADGAADLQRTLCRRALATACAAAPGAVTLFTAGDDERGFWAECRAGFGMPVAVQRGADLGARMFDALSRLLEHSAAAVLIGTDCPALTRADLARTRTRLASARMVFAPAEDGGYVLVGARELARAAFHGIAWGEDSVMRDTRRALLALGWRAGVDWQELPLLWDVDRPADYVRARAAGLLDAPAPVGAGLRSAPPRA